MNPSKIVTSGLNDFGFIRLNLLNILTGCSTLGLLVGIEFVLTFELNHYKCGTPHIHDSVILMNSRMII